MKDRLLKLSVKLQMLPSLIMSEDGQDLVEYGLVVGLIAFGATAALESIGTSVSTIFTDISTALTGAVGVM